MYSTTTIYKNFENASSNTSTRKTCPPAEFDSNMLQVYYTEIVCLSVIFTLATIGNMCVLLVLFRRRSKPNRMHLFILHLSLSDLIVAFFQVLPELIERLICGFHASVAMCKFIKYMQILGMYGSTYVLICTAFDRFFAIRYPMRSLRWSRGFVHYTVIGAWVVSALLSIPQIFVFDLEQDKSCMTRMSKKWSRIYTTWFFFMILVIPTLLLSYFYGMIAKTVLKNAKIKKQIQKNPKREQMNTSKGGKTKSEFTPRASGIGVISRAKLKTVKMTLVIVITFVICWAPFYTARMINEWWPAQNFENDNPTGANVIFLLGSFNSCTNPWIYLCFSGTLLKELKRQYCCFKQDKKANGRFLLQPITSEHNTMHSYVTNESNHVNNQVLTKQTTFADN